MKIGIEAERANIASKTGVEHYAKELILHLSFIDSKNEYFLYLRTKPEQWMLSLPKNFHIKVMSFPIFWTQLRISLEMLLHPVDVLFVPASALPIFHPKNSVVTIHDLAWKYFPEADTVFNRTFLEWSSWFAVKSASRVIAVSSSTAKDLEKHYAVSAKKLFVVHHGYSAESERQKHQLSPEVASRLPEKYVLFLSTLQPRKNLQGLVRAFGEFRRENPDLPHKLVVVGKPGWKFESILEALEAHREFVVYLNYVSNSDRWLILQRADLMVLPSFYEGFGMTILEAFAAKIPLAVSNTSSMPEIAGNGAAYFDPTNEEQIKTAISRILHDQSYKDNLVKNGAEQLKNFSWEKCASETLEVLTKLNVQE